MKKSNKNKLQNLQKGQVIQVPFNQRVLDAIVIDPNGLAESQPSIGMGFRMMSKHGGTNPIKLIPMGDANRRRETS